MDLEMEKLRIDATGISVTHQRCKQRSDKRSTSFLVPRAQTEEDLNYAGVVEQYITTIKTELGKFSGRLFWTGNQRTFVNSPLGKNRISEIPKQMAEYLNKENVSAFTFHSLRRSCSMPQQYISTSKVAVKNMANLLKAGGPGKEKNDVEGMKKFDIIH